jgi:hypothetical protein
LRKELKCGDLKNQVCLKHGKVDRSIKEPKQKKFKPKDEVAKTGLSGLGFQTIQFFQSR